ncbi:MAG: outer membrane beta-barrel protein [Gallionella sp.]|nr:outer membrane beta-barrel protein [Gallionella sp.]
MSKFILTALLYLLVVSPVFADEDSGLYIGLGFGMSQSDSVDATIGSGTGSTRQFCWGYKFNQYVSMGFEYGGFEANNASSAGDNSPGLYISSAFMITLAYPINEKFSVLGRSGMGLSVDAIGDFIGDIYSGSKNNSTFLGNTPYGIGAQYMINDDWALRGTLDRWRYNTGLTPSPNVSKGTANIFMGQVLYIF